VNVSHIKPKGKYPKLRHDLENIIILCWRCHIHWWHKEPLEAAEWIAKELPPEWLARLKLRAVYNDRSSTDYRLIEVFLKTEIKKLERARASR
jgi:5-methylcytosine-specific restriction endonuclease McrA